MTRNLLPVDGGSRRRLRLGRPVGRVAGTLLALGLLVWGGAWLRSMASSGPWRSLAPSGPGYRTYSWLASALGRQYVRQPVDACLTAAFEKLHGEEPERVFVVAETGWRGGGELWPHHTHRTGYAVDILVPVRGSDEAPAELPAWPWTLWAYYWHFDRDGRLDGLAWEAGGTSAAVPIPWTATVDFEAMAKLILELDAEARSRRGRVQRVIVTPDYHGRIIAAAPAGGRRRIRQLLHLREVWIRHDEHIHVDFAFRPAPD